MGATAPCLWGLLASAAATTAVLTFMRLHAALFPLKGVPCHIFHMSAMMSGYKIHCKCVCNKPEQHKWPYEAHARHYDAVLVCTSLARDTVRWVLRM